MRVAFALIALSVTGCCKLPVPAEQSEPDKPLPAVAAGETAFDMDVACDNDPGLRIRRIVLTASETRVYLHMENPSKQVHVISTAAPGKADTFFLEAADQHRHVQLKSSSGIAISPSDQRVEPGGKVDFVLYFPAIDSTWSPIDLHEGEIKKEGTTFWNFTGVPLKQGESGGVRK